jgi:uncharacterized protein (DUF849 family)
LIHKREEQAKKNREEMPNVAAMLDRIREANPDLAFKVIGAEDKVTGKKIGTL